MKKNPTREAKSRASGTARKPNGKKNVPRTGAIKNKKTATNGRTELPEVRISTDGSARPDSPHGTWGAVIRMKKLDGTFASAIELSGIRYGNGRRSMLGASMELFAAVRALASLEEPHKVELRTDCTYVSQGLSCKRLRRWVANNWKTNSKRPCTGDIPLWKELVREAGRHDIIWVHVGGHAGDPDNVRADQLCREAWGSFF